MASTGPERQRIWSRLRQVARPDSRFHLDFADFIPDFDGSDAATDRLWALPAARAGRFVFATPDNGLVDLRRRFIAAGVPLVVSTYGIQRGFYLIAPGTVPPGHELYAAWLDGLEHFGTPITLEGIAARGRFDLLATGASAVSTAGIRFGKGHGFFDLEWGMFTALGVAHERTPVAALVHDVQVVEDRLFASPTDILVDHIATPTRLIAVTRPAPRPRGIRWELLDTQQITAIPPLAELRRLQGLSA